jgi:hypothetical protein
MLELLRWSMRRLSIARPKEHKNPRANFKEDTDQPQTNCAGKPRRQVEQGCKGKADDRASVQSFHVVA